MQQPILIKSRLITLLWNKTFWLVVASHATSFDQSECIISEKSINSTLKFLYVIPSPQLLKYILGTLLVVGAEDNLKKLANHDLFNLFQFSLESQVNSNS